MRKPGAAFEAIYRVARRIPEGRVAAYGQLALLADIPRGARIAGYAMAAAPPDVPAHRVVGSLGALAPDYAFGGLQRSMLEAEGVSFLENGRVDMGKCRWDGV